MSMAVIGVGLGTAVIGTAGTMYASNQQSKAAKSAANNVPQNPAFKAPKMPRYEGYDRVELDRLANNYDQQFFARSDADFRKRHRGLVQAEKLFEAQVLKDQKGDSELLPMYQGELARAGLGGALATFGDSLAGQDGPVGASTGVGTAKEAAVARNLGVGILAYQDRNRQNRLTSLTTAETLFPRRSFGMSGADIVNLEMADTANENNWRQANYASQFQTDQLNWRNDAQNAGAVMEAKNQVAAANAAKQGAIWSGIFNSLGSAAGAYGAIKPGASTTAATTTTPRAAPAA